MKLQNEFQVNLVGKLCYYQFNRHRDIQKTIENYTQDNTKLQKLNSGFKRTIQSNKRSRFRPQLEFTLTGYSLFSGSQQTSCFV